MSATAKFQSFGPFFSSGALVTAPHIYHYAAGTSTDKDAYVDRAKGSTVAQPLVGDSNGLASAYWDGLYKIVVKNAAETVTLHTWDNVRLIEGIADYKTAWTPTLSCTIPGDLSVSYLDNTGYYEISGNRVTAWFSIITSSFTYTTASGFLSMNTLPVVSTSGLNPWVNGSLIWGGITKASYASVIPFVAGGSLAISFSASGSGQPATQLAMTDLPTGGTVKLQGCVTYICADGAV